MIIANIPQEHASITIFDSRFTIESATREGKPTFIVSERTERGVVQEYTADTYLEALTRFVYCIDTQAQFHLRNDPAMKIEDNGVLTAAVCVEGSRQDDYTSKIIVLNPEKLRPEYRFASEQLILATGGFGCSPTARGGQITGINLSSSNDETHRREDFLGIADVSRLPPWARSAWHELSVLNRHAPDAPKREPKPPTR